MEIYFCNEIKFRKDLLCGYLSSPWSWACERYGTECAPSPTLSPKAWGLGEDGQPAGVSQEVAGCTRALRERKPPYALRDASSTWNPGNRAMRLVKVTARTAVREGERKGGGLWPPMSSWVTFAEPVGAGLGGTASDG